jgi:hypothetical protein
MRVLPSEPRRASGLRCADHRVALRLPNGAESGSTFTAMNIQALLTHSCAIGRADRESKAPL